MEITKNEQGFEVYTDVLSSATEKPSEIDVTSSSYYAYVREDIQAYETEGDESQPPFKGWKYTETKIPIEVFTRMQAAKVKELESQLKEQELNTALMITDLYELQLEAMGEGV